MEKDCEAEDGKKVKKYGVSPHAGNFEKLKLEGANGGVRVELNPVKECIASHESTSKETRERDQEETRMEMVNQEM